MYHCNATLKFAKHGLVQEIFSTVESATFRLGTYVAQHVARHVILHVAQHVASLKAPLNSTVN